MGPPFSFPSPTLTPLPLTRFAPTLECMRALLLGLLTACTTLPAADLGDDDSAAPPAAGASGVPSAGNGGTAGASEPPASGTGGVAGEKTGAAGAGVAGESSAGVREDGGAPPEEPECCSHQFNGVGQCINTASCAGAGGMGVSGSSSGPCKCGTWSCCATHDAFGECTSMTNRSGCADKPDDFAGCLLTVPSC